MTARALALVLVLGLPMATGAVAAVLAARMPAPRADKIQNAATASPARPIAMGALVAAGCRCAAPSPTRPDTRPRK